MKTYHIVFETVINSEDTTTIMDTCAIMVKFLEERSQELKNLNIPFTVTKVQELD